MMYVTDQKYVHVLFNCVQCKTNKQIKDVTGLIYN